MTDPRIWLEDVDGSAALDWVRARNVEAEADVFADPGFDPLRRRLLEVLEAEDRIAYPSVHGERVHNFWTDATNRRGLLRRTTWDDYRAGEPEWETILDVDALGVAENESWVAAGTSTRRPDRARMLIDLSPGGSDASTTREFDLDELRFVPEEEGGFVRPVAKGGLSWIDDDTVYAATDLGDGTMTRSGYPRQVRRWRRGTALADAPVVFEVDERDIRAGAGVSTMPGFRHEVFHRSIDFYNGETWILRDGQTVRIDVPTHVDVVIRGPWISFSNRLPWTVGGAEHAGGSLLLADLDGFLSGDDVPAPVFSPTPTRALASSFFTATRLVLNVMEDVRTSLSMIDLSGVDGSGDRTPVAVDGAPDVWSLAAGPVDADESDDLWVMGNDFLTPESLFRLSLADGTSELLRQAPHRFDASGLEVTQHFVSSVDGTRVPYFEVGRTDRSAPGPTLLGGYGGFEVPSLPAYAPALGRAWLDEGRTYVLANIRGGGEYGPDWHRAGLREQRPRVYEDFEAVARDLIDRGVTTSELLGCSGGSNGGLLVGNMYVRSPELWGAVVCQVPLLDMQRYHRLLAGASWMAEYGDPDEPEDWSYLEGYSPYHQVDPATPYPPILLTTSTRDDRVHPGHARKMAHLLHDLGKDVTYWENIEGGHGGAADAAQRATMQALIYTFLRARLTSSE